MSAGDYHVVPFADEHVVVFIADETPSLWRVIARFPDADRAAEYAERENIKALPPPESPKRSTAPKKAGQATPRETEVWKALSAAISETGLCPVQIDLAHRLGIGGNDIFRYVRSLEAKGYLRRTGNRRSTLIHILRWPDGVAPRETGGREDGYVKPAPTPARRTAEAEPDQEQWLRANGGPSTEPNLGDVSREVKFLKSVDVPIYRDAKKVWRMGNRAVTEAQIKARAIHEGFGKKKKQRTKPDGPAELPEPSSVMCVRPGCRNTAQGGRDICATCNAVELAGAT